MSLSRTATNSHADPAALHGQDFLVSLFVHALVIITIIALALWKSENITQPLQRIQVSMITPDQLDKMIHQASVKRHVEPKPQPAKPIQHAPKIIKHVEPKPQPAKPIQHAPKIIKHVEKPLPKKTKPLPSKLPSLPKKHAKPQKHEPAFNPFAPLESKSDVKSSSPTHRNSNSALANMQMQQLSKQEANRYIAMIQDAVKRHWKVPVSLGHVNNPVVELKLRPDGSVVSIRILESSGDVSLDASLSRAIRAAAPFTLPQKQFEAFRDNKITFVPQVNQK